MLSSLRRRRNVTRSNIQWNSRWTSIFTSKNIKTNAIPVIYLNFWTTHDAVTSWKDLKKAKLYWIMCKYTTEVSEKCSLSSCIRLWLFRTKIIYMFCLIELLSSLGVIMSVLQEACSQKCDRKLTDLRKTT